MEISIRVEGRGGSLPSFFLEPALQNLRHALLGHANRSVDLRLAHPLTGEVHNRITLRALAHATTGWAHLYASLNEVAPDSRASHAMLLTDLEQS